MSSIIQQLSNQQIWEEFLAYRLQKGRLNWREFDRLDFFVESQQYSTVVNRLMRGEGLSIPQRRVINKMGTGKKRVVYTHSPEEMLVLKVIAHQLYQYDKLFAPNCYAFRKGLQASDAVVRVHNRVRNRPMWAYKLDIQNYFNSIPIPKLLPMLKRAFAEDQMLYDFFERMLTNNQVAYRDEIFEEEHGIMAGTPTSPFLADLFLNDVDHYFHQQGVIYARYSDDIILFADSREELLQYKATLNAMIAECGLQINPTKERIFAPEEGYEFLGFKCKGEQIDIASASIRKMKGKIRRKMHSLLRWKERKGRSSEQAISRMIEHFNKLFFEYDEEQSLTWSRWCFPTITQSDGLHEIDQYLQQSLRVLTTGRHAKANYRTSYDKLKTLGYRTLVNAYYQSKNEPADA